ncbi:hypothetical protein J3F83DRAFT_754586 [Trichoderma novae-zelandiae]
MTTREVAALISQSHPVASYPGPVTSTTEAPPQSLLAKQRNLAPTSTDPTNEQDAAPLEDADKELLVERVRNTGAQTPSSLAAQIGREQQQKTSS